LLCHVSFDLVGREVLPIVVVVVAGGCCV